MYSVELKKLEKTFGTTKVIQGVDLQVEEGEFLVLVGPSGCGKSTLLRMIAGLEEVTAGTVEIAGRDVTGVDPKDRDIAMVFQNYALYPHMSVFENMAFGLRVRKVADSEVKKRVRDAAELLQLSPLLERRPKELSGGQRQRVALGRAIVRQSKVFLFDEPLSNLDAKLRNQMRVEIKKLHQILGNTMIYVTHDQVEATTMGDRIAVLEQGYLQQLATPKDLYSNPSNQFVAGFIGVPEMNFVDGQIVTDKDEVAFEFAGGRLLLTGPVTAMKEHAGKAVVMGCRPEFLSLDQDERNPNSSYIDGKVDLIENLGSQSLVHVAINGVSIRVTADYEKNVEISETVRIFFNLTKIYFFDKSGVALWPDPV